MRRGLGVLLVVTVGAACGGETASTSTSSATTTTECVHGPSDMTTARYADTAQVEANLQSLDVYPTGDCGPNPAVVWVHGGGWRTGDKGNDPVEQKAAWAAEHGWVLVAVNYRLSRPGAGVQWPDHGEDVADAIGWVLDHAEELGVDPGRLALMGHSAGGHLVSIVATDPDLMADAGHERTDVDCVIALDAAGYDLERRAEESRRPELLLENAFGDDPTALEAASPTHQLTTEGGPVADFLVVTRGTAGRQEIATDFADAVEEAEASAEVLVADGYSHSEVNDAVGADGEDVVTPAVEDFLSSCLSGG